jgi:peptidyl-prolyl cis-trans isomerase C
MTAFPRPLVPTLALAVAVLTLACGGHPAPGVTFGSLGGDVAHVGRVTVSAALVGRVASEQRTTPRQALEGLVQDALLAEGARARGLDSSPQARWAVEAALATRTATRLRDEAMVAGPPGDEELAQLTVVHAVVRASSSLSDGRAIAVAEAIAHAVEGARDGDDFLARARNAPHPPAPVIAQSLPPFDASGAMSQGMLDPEFVAAAFSLRQPGDTSKVVRTPFGWHVIRLVARTPPAPGVADVRRRDLAEAVQQLRVRMGIARSLGALRATAPVDVSASADELMARAAALTSP